MCNVSPVGTPVTCVESIPTSGQKSIAKESTMPHINRRQFFGYAAAASAGLVVPRIAAAQALTLDQIKKAGELRIGCEAAYVPFTYRQEGKIVACQFQNQPGSIC